MAGNGSRFRLLPPLDRVTVRGHIDLAQPDFLSLMQLATGRPKRPRKLVHLFGAFRDENGGANTLHLDIDPVGRPRQGQVATHLIFTQDWFESWPRSLRKDSGAEDLKRIDSLLRKLDSVSEAVRVDCHVDWVYKADTTIKPVFPLPFPIALKPESGMSLVKGIRVSNPDATQWAIVDQVSGGGLQVTVAFEDELAIGSNTIAAVVDRGERIIAGVLE